MEKLLVIAGTNASGKSGLGIELAKIYGAEIVSADSRQVYKGLDLGSGKVTAEEMQGVPHHLLDVAEPNDFYTLLDYQKQAYAAIDDIHTRGKKAFLVGGTGLYVNAVVDGYNIVEDSYDPKLREQTEAMSLAELWAYIGANQPEALEKLDPHNKVRLERAAEKIMGGKTMQKPNAPHYETLVLGVTWPREVLYERIRERLDRRLQQGMLEEVENLRKNGATDEFLYRLGLEYRYIMMYLRGDFESFDAFYNKLFMEIRHLAKEQMTWFRKRKDMVWIDMEKDPLSAAQEAIDVFYAE